MPLGFIQAVHPYLEITTVAPQAFTFRPWGLNHLLHVFIFYFFILKTQSLCFPREIPFVLNQDHD